MSKNFSIGERANELQVLVTLKSLAYASTALGGLLLIANAALGFSLVWRRVRYISVAFGVVYALNALFTFSLALVGASSPLFLATVGAFCSCKRPRARSEREQLDRVRRERVGERGAAECRV